VEFGHGCERTCKHTHGRKRANEKPVEATGWYPLQNLLKHLAFHLQGHTTSSGCEKKRASITCAHASVAETGRCARIAFAWFHCQHVGVCVVETPRGENFCGIPCKETLCRNWRLPCPLPRQRIYAEGSSSLGRQKCRGAGPIGAAGIAMQPQDFSEPTPQWQRSSCRNQSSCGQNSHSSATDVSECSRGMFAAMVCGPCCIRLSARDAEEKKKADRIIDVPALWLNHANGKSFVERASVVHGYVAKAGAGLPQIGLVGNRIRVTSE
jgi:hypothetical protein